MSSSKIPHITGTSSYHNLCHHMTPPWHHALFGRNVCACAWYTEWTPSLIVWMLRPMLSSTLHGRETATPGAYCETLPQVPQCTPMLNQPIYDLLKTYQEYNWQMEFTKINQNRWLKHSNLSIKITFKNKAPLTIYNIIYNDSFWVLSRLHTHLIVQLSFCSTSKLINTTHVWEIRSSLVIFLTCKLVNSKSVQFPEWVLAEFKVLHRGEEWFICSLILEFPVGVKSVQEIGQS